MKYQIPLLPYCKVAVMNFHTTLLFSLLPLWYEIIVSEILHFSCYNFAFLTLFDFLFSQECQSCDSEVPVWIFPSHSCQKSLSKSLGFASWLGKTFLAFVTWKNPYWHFLITGLVHYKAFLSTHFYIIETWRWQQYRIRFS